jgi:hypothetical protein
MVIEKENSEISCLPERDHSSSVPSDSLWLAIVILIAKATISKPRCTEGWPHGNPIYFFSYGAETKHGGGATDGSNRFLKKLNRPIQSGGQSMN